MSDSASTSLNHFSMIRFTDDYWRLSTEDREVMHAEWYAKLKDASTAIHCYQLAPTESAADLLLWSAVPLESEDMPARFFNGFAAATTPFRRYVGSDGVLWGFTRSSQYSTSRSRQQIDPFGSSRPPYLVIYPFSKTKDWYLMNQEARQGMMNEHIRIGKQYESIKQLLLYSFGLQDQEFVVVYETDDLALFSKLVHDLRMTEARRFTLNDTPVHTGVHCPSENPFALWR